MEPSYRIDLEHEPTERTLPWTARVFRLADDTHVKTEWGTTRTEAFENAQAWVKRASSPTERGVSVFLSEDGEIHEASAADVAGRMVAARAPFPKDERLILDNDQ